jgi:hypothetical protein
MESTKAAAAASRMIRMESPRNTDIVAHLGLRVDSDCTGAAIAALVILLWIVGRRFSLIPIRFRVDFQHFGSRKCGSYEERK